MSDNIIAIDYGAKRVGLARASSIARLPEPLATLENNSNLVQDIVKLCEEHQAELVVVGLPRSLEGIDTEQTKETRIFMESLREAGLKVIEQDEALTSDKAHEELATRHGVYQKTEVDQLAAVYILEDYLNDKHRSETYGA